MVKSKIETLEKEARILWMLLGALIITNVFIVSQLIELRSNFIDSASIVKSDENYLNISSEPSCDFEEISDIGFCLRDLVSENFKYKRMTDNIFLSEEKLLKSGGDCQYWALFYVEKAKQLGLSGDIIRIPGDLGFHDFALISSKEGYCILDQRSAMCIDYA